MPIDATVGGASSNSYNTLIEANTYFNSRLNSDTWDEASDPEQEVALIQSTIVIDEFDYIGDPATTTQALKWPRIENDLFTRWDRTFPFASTVIPPRLKYAQLEVAIHLLGLAASGATTTSSQPISSLKIGSTVEVKYDTSSGVVVDTTVDQNGLVMTAARFLKGLRLPVIAV